MKKLFGLFFSIFLISFLAACGGDEPKVEVTGKIDYFPLKPGSWYLYKVDSIDFVKRPYDTTTFWIRELVKSETTTLDGNDYFQIFVYKKYKWTDNWQKTRTDLARVSSADARRYSENIMYLKHIYPLNLDVEWNAAPFNNVAEQFGERVTFEGAHFVRINDYHILGDRGYDSTLNVELFSHYDLINRIDFRERYANHIGLYRKFELNAEFQFEDPENTDSVNNLIPYSGYKYIQTLIDFSIAK